MQTTSLIIDQNVSLITGTIVKLPVRKITIGGKMHEFFDLPAPPHIIQPIEQMINRPGICYTFENDDSLLAVTTDASVTVNTFAALLDMAFRSQIKLYNSTFTRAIGASLLTHPKKSELQMLMMCNCSIEPMYREYAIYNLVHGLKCSFMQLTRLVIKDTHMLVAEIEAILCASASATALTSIVMSNVLLKDIVNNPFFTKPPVSNQYLEHLDISHNQFERIGWICEYVHKSARISYLDMTNTNCYNQYNEWGTCVATMIQTTKSLKTLILDYNYLNEEFLDLFTEEHCLQHVSLQHNLLGTVGKVGADTWKFIRRLESCDIGFNQKITGANVRKIIDNVTTTGPVFLRRLNVDGIESIGAEERRELVKYINDTLSPSTVDFLNYE